MKFISVILAAILFVTNFNPLAMDLRRARVQVALPAVACGETDDIFLPIVVKAMAQPTITENLESIIRQDAAFPYDGRITQVFATTVNVLPVGSRTIIRDVALPTHITADDVAVGYAVRLGQVSGKPTVTAVFEQFADPEMFNYAGVGSRVPVTPTVTVQATQTGWLVSWNNVGASQYILYKNDTADGDSPEEVIRLSGSQFSYLVDYDEQGLFRYFAVKACRGYLESDVSLWLTDQTPPTTPTWASHSFQADGHHVTWSHPAAADVKEFVLYRNTSAGDEGAIEVTRTTNLSEIIPYSSKGDWFGVQAIDWTGLNISTIVWTNQAYDPTPAVPDTFLALGDIQGHKLTITGNDASLSKQSLRYWEIEQATDAAGANSVSLGEFYAADFPTVLRFGSGTTRYYRIRAVDWAGNTSAWTGWDYAIAGQSEIEDRFDRYGWAGFSELDRLYWLSFPALTTAEWTVYSGTGVDSSVRLIDTNVSIKATNAILTRSFPQTIDFQKESRFTNADYILISAYVETLGDQDTYVKIYAYSAGGGGGYYYYSWDLTTTGWHYLIAKRGWFLKEELPPFTISWSDINRIDVIASAGVGTATIYVDDLRIVKADPDDADTYNDTGDSWDKLAHTGTDFGEWHIYEGNRTGEPGKPFSYGQIREETTPAVWYLSYKPLATTDIFTGTIQAGVYLKAEGQTGLSFFVKDTTPDNWNMYAVEADSAADTIKLVKWVNGVRTEIASTSFTFAPNQFLWLGADFREYDANGRIKIHASFSEGNLIQASTMIISAQDTEWVGSAGGSVGLLSYQVNVRFVSFVAGSPAHAEVADVARALDGPIIFGMNGRVWLRDNGGSLEKSTDGATWQSAFVSDPWPDARSKAVLAGGGNIYWDGSTVSWTNRFIWLPFDKDLATSGYFQTASSGSQALSSWQGLYYVPPIGGGGATSGTLQVYHYSSHNIPPNALLICYRHADTIDSLVFANGQRLRAGQSIANGLGSASWQTEQITAYRTSNTTIAKNAWQYVYYNAYHTSVNIPSGATKWDGSTAIYTWGPGIYRVLGQIAIAPYEDAYVHRVIVRILINGSTVVPGYDSFYPNAKYSNYWLTASASVWVPDGMNAKYFQMQSYVELSNYYHYAWDTGLSVQRLPA